MSLVRTFYGAWPALLLLVAGCGAGSKLVSFEGIVTLDGQPLEGAAVSFVPNQATGRPARGQTDASGKFRLTTTAPGDGALPGTYRVGISKLEAAQDQRGDTPHGAPAGTQLSGPPGAAKGPPPAPKSLVPPTYVNPDTSGFTIEVKAGMEPVKLELKSK